MIFHAHINSSIGCLLFITVIAALSSPFASVGRSSIIDVQVLHGGNEASSAIHQPARLILEISKQAGALIQGGLCHPSSHKYARSILSSSEKLVMGGFGICLVNHSFASQQGLELSNVCV